MHIHIYVYIDICISKYKKRGICTNGAPMEHACSQSLPFAKHTLTFPAHTDFSEFQEFSEFLDFS
jgi:hypothetical protein